MELQKIGAFDMGEYRGEMFELPLWKRKRIPKNTVKQGTVAAKKAVL